MVKGKSQAASHAANKLARLAAVQALYQNAFEQETLKQIISDAIDFDFAGLREHDDGDESITQKPAPELFGIIVQGVSDDKVELDSMIAGALDKKLTADRLEILLHKILLAGVFELWRCPKVPSGVIINDYVDVARAFYNAKEPGLVNGVLDKLAKKLRKN